METVTFERNFRISLNDRFLMVKLGGTFNIEQGETQKEATKRVHDNTIATYLELYPHMKEFLYEEEPKLKPQKKVVVVGNGQHVEMKNAFMPPETPIIQVNKAQEAKLLDNYTTQIQQAKTLQELEGYDAILQKFPALEIVWKEKYIQLQNS